MKCVIYARYSSDNQREESITAQIRAITAYANQQGYTILRTFTDEARSATTDDRPGFLEMINTLTSGLLKADIVLVHKLDRFARNRYDSAFYRRELRKAGARLESVLERFDDSPESILMESMLEGMAEYFSKNLAREIMKGMKETALQGKHTGGRPALGYQVDHEGRYQIDPRGSDAVKLIFSFYIAGCSYPRIIEQLHTEGHTTRDGKPFRKNCIHDILKNRKYIGIYEFNRQVAKTVDGKRNSHASKAQEAIITIPGAVPAIIDQTTWEAAQAMMSKNIHGGGRYKAKVDYLLSGVLVCGECGAHLVGKMVSRKQKDGEPVRYHYYTCPTPGCSTKSITKDRVETLLLANMNTNIFNEQAMVELTREIVAYIASHQQEKAGEGEYLQGEIRRLDRQINNVIDAIADGVSNRNELAAKLNRLGEEKDLLESRFQTWEVRVNNQLDKGSVLEYLRRQRHILHTGTPAQQKQVIRDHVEKVTVNGEEMNAYYVVNFFLSGAGEGSRTPTRLPSVDFESTASAIPPHRHGEVEVL